MAFMVSHSNANFLRHLLAADLGNALRILLQQPSKALALVGNSNTDLGDPECSKSLKLYYGDNKQRNALT